MRLLKIFALVLLATAIAIPMWMARSVQGQSGLQEAPTVNLDHTITADNIEELFNGFGDLGTPVPDGEDPVPDRSFIDNVAIFASQEEVDEGLGPVYNARSCGECHDNTAIGGRSQLAELRAGRTVGGVFSPQDDNSLINQRAICANAPGTTRGSMPIRRMRTPFMC